MRKEIVTMDQALDAIQKANADIEIVKRLHDEAVLAGDMGGAQDQRHKLVLLEDRAWRLNRFCQSCAWEIAKERLATCTHEPGDPKCTCGDA